MPIDIPEIIRDHVLLFDGAMGTMLQKANLPTGALLETYCITHPEIVTGIHKRYVEAGAEVVSANTFQANPFKLNGCGYTIEEIISAAVNCAKVSGAQYCALDIGPTSKLLEPMGELTFEDAYSIFSHQAILGEKAGADLIIFETFSDLYEMKAAVLAAKENTSLPVIASLSFQADGRTFVGCDPVTAALTLSGLGVAALGVNCSLGPREIEPIIEQLLRCATAPVIVQANAGLPHIVDGQPIYDITPVEYASRAAQFVQMGVQILGGCCGTEPAFIAEIKKAVSTLPLKEIHQKDFTAASSGSKAVFFGNSLTFIGDRLSTANNDGIIPAIESGDIDFLAYEAVDQIDEGFHLINVNVDIPGTDQVSTIVKAIKSIQSTVRAPIAIESADPAVIAAGARVYNGRPVLNAVNGSEASMKAIFPIAKKYGALVIALTTEESVIPKTALECYEIAKKIVNRAAEYGISRHDIIIDCALIASPDHAQNTETLHVMRLIKHELGVKTMLGVGSIFRNIPESEKFTASFLHSALDAGLDAVILGEITTEITDIT